MVTCSQFFLAIWENCIVLVVLWCFVIGMGVECNMFIFGRAIQTWDGNLNEKLHANPLNGLYAFCQC